MQKENCNSIAISTTWNESRSSNVKDMLEEIKGLGFDKIEVGYSISSDKLEALSHLIKNINIEVVSIHNFCPLPPNPQLKRHVSDYYRISSLDEEERQKAVEYTKRTIDTAKRLSAQAVVIHAGTVEMDENYVGRMIDLFQENKVNSIEYQEFKEEFLYARENRKGPYLEAVAKSLRDIFSYAAISKVKIGLETRYSPEDIPNFAEIGHFLNLFSNEGLYYWHDVGHAVVNDRLGLRSHLTYLEEYSGRLLGMHIHDIKGLKDHLAPFAGDLDYSGLLPYLSKDGLIKVIEVHSQATSQEIKESMKRLS